MPKFTLCSQFLPTVKVIQRKKRKNLGNLYQNDMELTLIRANLQVDLSINKKTH